MYRLLYPLRRVFKALELVVWIPYWLLGELFTLVFEAENTIDMRIDKGKTQSKGIKTVYTNSK